MCGEEAAESQGVEGDWANEEWMGRQHCSYRADSGIIPRQGAGTRLGPRHVITARVSLAPGHNCASLVRTELLSLVVLNPIPCFLRKPASKF